VTDAELAIAYQGDSPSKTMKGLGAIKPDVLDRLLGRHRDTCTPQQHTHARANKSCEENPRCLFGLGERNQGIWASSFRTEGELQEAPETVAVREAETLVGLRNQGATCYMNSLVQVLFMNPCFRHGLFSWSPDQDGEGISSDVAICKELQELMVRMEHTKDRSLVPETFTQALGLSKMEQQDAQEFNQLLLTLLDKVLGASGHGDVKALIPSQFRIDTVQEIKCGNCDRPPSTRDNWCYQLEIPINDVKSLEDGLKNVLAVEHMTDDCKVWCDGCQSKENATRRDKLKQLPEIINLPLMRFVFDMKTLSKKKLKSAISFPEFLDMEAIMRDESAAASAEKSKPSLNPRKKPKVAAAEDPEASSGAPSSGHIYRLAAVMMHKGMSAHHGHYVVQVRDEVKGKWHLCDDDDIQDQKPADLGQVDEYDISTDGTSKKVKKEKGNGKVQEGKVRFTSSNAYMLIYVKDRRQLPPLMVAPAAAKERVEAENRDKAESRRAYEATIQAEKEELEQRKQQYRTNIEQCVKDEELEYWLDAKWLEKYVQELTPPEIDNSDIMCQNKEHGHAQCVDFRKKEQLKLVSRSTWEALLWECNKVKVGESAQELPSKSSGVGSEASCPDTKLRGVCPRCLDAELKKRVESYKESNKHERMKNLLANKVDDKDGFYVSSQQLKAWKKGDPTADTVLNDDIVCECEEDRRLGPVRKQARVAVSVEAWSELKTHFPGGAVELKGSQGVCEECEQQSKLAVDEDRNLKRERKPLLALHKKIMNAAKTRVQDHCHGFYFVSRVWLDMWEVWLQSEDKMEGPGEITSGNLLCEEHGMLQWEVPTDGGVDNGSDDYLDNFVLVSAENWNLLKERYGGDDGIIQGGQQVCKGCRIKRLETAASGLQVFDDCPISVKHEGMLAESQAGSEKSEEAKPFSFIPAGSEGALLTTEEPLAKARPRRARRDKSRKEVRVNSSDKLWDVKVRICREFSVIPSSQHIRVSSPQNPEKVSLRAEDNEKTLRELNIMRNCTLHVWTIPYDEDAATNSQPAVELGFAGTALGGGDGKKPNDDKNGGSTDDDVVVLSP